MAIGLLPVSERQILPAQNETVSGDFRRSTGNDAPSFGGIYVAGETSRHHVCDFVLELEDIAENAVISIGPQHSAAICLEQLCRHPESCATAPDGADSDVARAEYLTDFGG